MFLKAKIYFTIFSVYEMVMIMLLHSRSTCLDVFSNWFCADSLTKYFLFCVIVPLTVFLVIMWIEQIRKAIKHRHSILYQAKERFTEVAGEVKETIKDNINNQDLEAYLMALAMSGIRSYMNNHPEKRDGIERFIKAMMGMPEVYNVNTAKKTKRKKI